MKGMHLCPISIIFCLFMQHSLSAPRVTEHSSLTPGATRNEATAAIAKSRDVSVFKFESNRHKDLEVDKVRDPHISQDPENRPAILTTEEKHLVYASQAGRLVLAGVMGACIGLFSGFLLTVVACCCFLKFSNRYGNLEFDKHNNTYRSGELIDGTV